jgi:hypothetical protein
MNRKPPPCNTLQDLSTKLVELAYTIKMHEYITSYIRPSYNQCIDCNKRTTHICIRCHYCYSCHYKIEDMEKQRQNVKTMTTSKRYHPRGFDRRILASDKTSINNNII